MSDIVERLRVEAAAVPITLALNAAAEIERLRAALGKDDHCLPAFYALHFHRGRVCAYGPLLKAAERIKLEAILA
jgi:hypothetical protein